MKLIGEYIRELREQQKLPLRKVAAYLDLDISILSKIERGERAMNINHIVRIAEYFGLDKQELLIEYLGEEVAKKVYQSNNITQILEVAEKKAEYLRSRPENQKKK